MFVMHIALQGCVRPGEIDYGVTPDTGGHIKYVLELARALQRNGVDHQEIVVRRFVDAHIGLEYGDSPQRLSHGVDIVRIDGASTRYIAKERLWEELDVLTDNVVRHIKSSARRPDLIHAHCGDAGAVAAILKERYGIPYVFTGHSLGVVKKHAMKGNAPPGLERRIAIEERAIDAADRIVASSLDEAELQYRFHKSARPEKIVVNPPGCDLERFSYECDRPYNHAIVRELRRFLTDMEKPPVLALARPVKKKNLAALIHAFGRSKDLQDRANLVIFAGVRDDLRACDDECREVLNEILQLIDHYDLWGKVAIPKKHSPADVPDLYRLAYCLNGVFANPAFNEPFGLTLLEAAASGVPVVATNSGGPNDIIGKCENGALVPPNDWIAIADAVLQLLNDPDKWSACSRNGLERSRFYNWDRHALEYLKMAQSLKLRNRTAITRSPPRALLVSDIDNTLTGDSASLRRLSDLIAKREHLAFAIATGRSLHSAIDALKAWAAPMPEALITSVGSEIYYVNDIHYTNVVADRNWSRIIAGEWEPAKIGRILEGVRGLTLQPAREQRAFKSSYFVNDKTVVSEVRRRLTSEGVQASVIYSHGRFLDILPKRADKGAALTYLAERFGVDDASTIAAGDSGNDLQMLERAAFSIIVDNHTSELDDFRSRRKTYFARSPFAAGVIEGVYRFENVR